MENIKRTFIDEPLLFELSKPGRSSYSLPEPEVSLIEPKDVIPKELLRDDIEGFPELSELDVVRHYTRLSQWNMSVDTTFYPLGSCTMKYNPKINEEIAQLKGFSTAHPYQPEEFLQGALEVIYEIEQALKEITGMDHFTLQPAAGAQGELTGMMMIRAYHVHHGNPRSKVLIPDTAHGTNPASSALCNYKVETIKSGKDGILEPEEVAKHVDEEVAALMVTNPNTLGLFERNIEKIAQIVHSAGAFLYCDGANLNALMGIVKPADLGFDVIQCNLHKTFSTPHGGGGPGSGPVGIKSSLAPYLPLPVVVKENNKFKFDYDRPLSIGKLKAFYGNFGVILRGYTYILEMGGENLKKASQMAVLNANYIMEKLKNIYHLPYHFRVMHECVFTDKNQSKYDVSTLDIAKRLIDYDFHPPTIYFPLVVHGAIMIEPTETEKKETLDEFIETMKKISDEAKNDPTLLKNAPSNSIRLRLDETTAARKPKLRWLP